MKWTLLPASEFDRHAVAWDELNRCGYHSPLLSSQFLRSSLRAFQSGKEMLAVLGNPDRPEVMTVLVQRGK